MNPIQRALNDARYARAKTVQALSSTDDPSLYASLDEAKFALSDAVTFLEEALWLNEAFSNDVLESNEFSSDEESSDWVEADMGEIMSDATMTGSR